MATKPFDWYAQDMAKGIPGMKADTSGDVCDTFAAEGGIDPGEPVMWMSWPLRRPSRQLPIAKRILPRPCRTTELQLAKIQREGAGYGYERKRTENRGEEVCRGMGGAQGEREKRVADVLDGFAD